MRRWYQKDDPSRKPDLKLSVPDVLKVILVDDWEAVTKNKQVMILHALWFFLNHRLLSDHRRSLHYLENPTFKRSYVILEITLMS